MGTGSSRNKVKKFDKGIQMPPASEIIVPTSRQSSSPIHDPLFTRAPRKTNNQRQNRIQEDVFELDNNIEDYSTIWNHDAKLSSSFQKLVKSDSNNIDHHQKETLNNKWNNKNTTTYNTTHIESIVDSQTHSCINLSSSDTIDELIKNLNHIHVKLDEIIKQRTEQVSNDTESLLSHIRHETQQKQQRLLNYAKDQQTKQDEHYQQLLQEYVSQLDQIKAKGLDDLQKQLEMYREQIMQESQIKIMAVNDQANMTKAKILQEEQQQAADKIDAIIHQIQKISADNKLQYLGSEIITKTQITTNANMGTKAPGQNCNFTFDENKQSNQRVQSNTKKI